MEEDQVCDLAKAVALMANHEGNVVDYSVNEGGTGKIQETVPTVAIPTTSGTGSEVSLGRCDNYERW